MQQRLVCMALTKDSSIVLQSKVVLKTISQRLDKYLTNERILVLEKLPGIFGDVDYSVDYQ